MENNHMHWIDRQRDRVWWLIVIEGTRVGRRVVVIFYLRILHLLLIILSPRVQWYLQTYNEKIVFWTHKFAPHYKRSEKIIWRFRDKFCIKILFQVSSQDQLCQRDPALYWKKKVCTVSSAENFLLAYFLPQFWRISGLPGGVYDKNFTVCMLDDGGCAPITAPYPCIIFW